MDRRGLAPELEHVISFAVRARRLRPRHPRPGPAAQPGGQGGHVRGPHAARPGHRRADRLPPRRRRRRRRPHDRRLPRGRAGGADPRASRSSSGRTPWPGCARLADAVHATGAAVAGQVGHAGPVANGRSNGVHGAQRQPDAEPAVDADGPLRDRAGPRPASPRRTSPPRARWSAPASTCSSCTWRTATCSPASWRPALNRRKDRWGGSLENRARLARQVARAVRDEVGGEVGGDRQGQPGRRLPRRRDDRGGARPRPACWRPTAPSTPCS